VTTNNTIECIKAELHENKKLFQKYRNYIGGLPEGSLQSRTIRNRKTYYHYPPSGPDKFRPRPKYISSKNLPLLYGLAKKRFLEGYLVALGNNISAAESFLKKYKYFDNHTIIEGMSHNFHEITETALANDPVLPSVSHWQQEHYEKNPYHPEGLNVRAQNGTMVRSKSEAIILGQLEIFDIPCRYESRLAIAGNNFFPDFTILSPKGNKIMYWEHFGMVDNADYEDSMEKKLRTYKEYGIVQWRNLIVTFETKELPLDALTVNNLIKAFLAAD
jgi:hypothetical protein